MSNIINIYEYPRVILGWGYLKDLIDFLGTSNKKIELVYLFETHELIITDIYITTALQKLNIPFEEKAPQNSIVYILK